MDFKKIAARVANPSPVAVPEGGGDNMSRNAELANKIAQAATLFADQVRCDQPGDEPDVQAVREAFEDLFEVWRDVDKGLV